MDDFSYRQRQSSHASFWFCVTTIAMVSVNHGLSALFSWPSVVYLLVGAVVSSIALGGINSWISGIFERRVNRRHKDLTFAEQLMGSSRIDAITRQGWWLGWLMTAIVVGAAIAAYFAFRAMLWS